MSSMPDGVAPSSGAGASAPSTAPVESTPSTSLPSNAPASTPSSAATGQPQSGLQPQETIGMKQLRDHAKSLETDLGRYKPVYEQIDGWGGIDTVKPAVDLYNSFSALRDFDPVTSAKNLYELNPQNVDALAKVLISEYPDYVKDALADEKFRQHYVRYDPEYASYLEWKQTQGAQPQQPPFQQQPQHAQPGMDPAIQQKLQALEAFKQSVEQREKTAAAEKLETAAREREAKVDNDIGSAIKSELSKLKGWADGDIESLEHDIVGAIYRNPQITSVIQDAKTAARLDAKGAQAKLKVDLARAMNQVMADRISRHSKYVQATVTAPQEHRAQAALRKDIPTTGTPPPPPGNEDLQKLPAFSPERMDARLAAFKQRHGLS